MFLNSNYTTYILKQNTIDAFSHFFPLFLFENLLNETASHNVTIKMALKKKKTLNVGL